MERTWLPPVPEWLSDFTKNNTLAKCTQVIIAEDSGGMNSGKGKGGE